MTATVDDFRFQQKEPHRQAVRLQLMLTVTKQLIILNILIAIFFDGLHSLDQEQVAICPGRYPQCQSIPNP